MTLDEMKQIKKEKGYSYEKLSELSGVPVGTMQKIFRGETQTPRYDTLQALERALIGTGSGNQAAGSCDSGYQTLTRTDAVHEAAAPYGSNVLSKKKQGEYTLEDYYALPEDKRYELIDGYLFELNAPATFHQVAAGEIYRQISNFIIDHDGSCMPFISPIDVQLDKDNRTMLQPDIIIMCDNDQILKNNIFGAPDFVLEVLSLGTKRRDCSLKLYKYQNAGVREYWIVDPYQKVVLVYFFESKEYMTIYPIDTEIPVNIYCGELKIDLKRILKWLPA